MTEIQEAPPQSTSVWLHSLSHKQVVPGVSGCHSKIVQTGRLPRQTLAPHNSGCRKVQGQGATVVWFLVRALSRCADGCLLTASSHSSRMNFVLLLFYKDTQPIMGAPRSGPHQNQITPQRHCKLMPSHRGTGSSTYGLGGTQRSVVA